MTLSWVACEMKTGRVIADLRDFDCATVSDTICGYTSTSGNLPVPTLPLDWARASLPMGAYFVLLDDTTPIWGGFVNQRVRSMGDLLPLPLVGIAAYFDRRFMSAATLTFTDVDQCTIVKTLVDTYVGDSLPIRVQASASAYTRIRTYLGTADKTILSLITELAAVINGPEWYVGWESGTSGGQVTYTPVLYVADRLGSTPSPGLDPAITFSMGGRGPFDMQEVEFTEDFSTGNGANDIIAVSTATGNVRPESPHQVFVDPDRPMVEFRFTPTPSIDDVDGDLTAHAAAMLARVKNGTQSLKMSLPYGDPALKLVDTLGMGDTTGLQIGGTATDGSDLLPHFPGGMTGRARFTGWSLSLTDNPMLSPVLEDLVVN